MKKNIFLLFAIVLTVSCNTNSKEEKKQATSDTDVATAFIRNTLDNNPAEAEQYLLKDETNTEAFERFKQSFAKKDAAELAKYKAADIVIYEIATPSDSVHVVTYTNSYKKDIKQNLKLVRQNNKWLIDFKYTFNQ
jgi:hypothetical protein